MVRLLQRLADGALDVTQVLDHVVELLDRLDAHGHDAVVLVRLVDGLLEPGRLEREESTGTSISIGCLG